MRARRRTGLSQDRLINDFLEGKASYTALTSVPVNPVVTLVRRVPKSQLRVAHFQKSSSEGKVAGSSQSLG